MKRKILGILVVTLFIATITLPTVSAPPTIDQSQENHYADYFISDFDWQEFVPQMEILNMVEVRVAQWFSGSFDLKLTVEKPLGTVLRTKEVPASLIPSQSSDWVMFDIPDIELTSGDTYVIRLTSPLGSEYSWGAGNGDPYPKGVSSRHPDDFCFRTWASNENQAPDKPSTPSGSTSGKAGTSYTYSTSADDQDGNQVYYKWYWGDEVSNWDGPYNSGDPVTTSHTWSNQGTYAVKVKAKDDPNGDGDLSDGLESVWSDTLSVSMPRNKPINTPFLRFLENHPNMFPLLRQLLEL